MLSIRKPSPRAIQTFLDEQAQLPFSYEEVGASRGAVPPPGFVMDHNRIRLGEGQEVFHAGCTALLRWEMFCPGWLELCWPETPVEPGKVVAVLVRRFGLWLLNACRIAYVIDEHGKVERAGFAYGTLPGHVERGEERFTVEWHHADNSVWYDLYAFSRPQHILTRLGYRYARFLQKRFARDSLAAMARAVQQQVINK